MHIRTIVDEKLQNYKPALTLETKAKLKELKTKFENGQIQRMSLIKN